MLLVFVDGEEEEGEEGEERRDDFLSWNEGFCDRRVTAYRTAEFYLLTDQPLTIISIF